MIEKNRAVLIGNLLLRLREREGLSQKELADKMNVTPPTIWKWEQGRRMINQSYYDRLAEIFDIDKAVFLYADQYLTTLPSKKGK